MKLFVIRHGCTKMNKEHLYNGQVDEDLVEEGIEDAKKAQKVIKNMKFDVIYCSPLLRAKHTCDIINVNKIPVIYDDRLKERTLGYLDGKSLPEEGLTEEQFYDYYYKSNIDNFEDLPTLFKRVHSFIEELKEKDYENILIVAHGGILRAIYFYFNEIPKDGNLISKYKSSKNCEINSYEINKNSEE